MIVIFSRAWFAIFLISLIVACLSVPLYAEIVINQPLMYATTDEAPKPLYIGGRPAIAYYDNKQWLKFKWAGDEGSLIISKQAHPEVKNSHIGFSSKDDNIYIFWRPKIAAGDKMGDKHILFSASYDSGKAFSAPKLLNADVGAFHPRRLETGSDGLLYLIWSDERAGNHRIYLNMSKDYGKTWLEHELKMNSHPENAYEPFISAYGQSVWVGWLKPEKGYSAFLFRYSEDNGGTWSDEIKIPTPDNWLFTPRMVYTNAGLLIIYYVDEKGIMYNRSRDGGKTWESPLFIPDTAVYGSSGFKIAKNTKGNICVMWPGPFKLGQNKADIFINCSNDGGITWAKNTTRLDTNTPMLTHSLAPDIAIDEEGRVVVVWQDLRNIRPNIYMNYSIDGGATWQKQDILINSPGGRGVSQFPSVATDGKGRFLIVWMLALSDSLKREYLLAYEEVIFKCPELASDKNRHICAPVIGLDEGKRRAKLASRVEEFWKAYVGKNYEKGYEMFDPFARARVSKQFFLSNVGQITYHEFKILTDTISINENFASVKVNVVFEAETFSVGQYEGSIPRTDRELDEKWIWIDNDWFKVYEISTGDFLPKI
jgi:hypothetical protein